MIIKIEDGTTWPNPNSEKLHDIMRKAFHSPGKLERHEGMILASVCESYCMLTTHPAFTLKKVADKVSMIREAIK